MPYQFHIRVASPHVLRDHLRETVIGYSQGSNIRHSLEDLLAQIEAQMPLPEPELDFSVINAIPSHASSVTTLTKLGGRWLDVDGNDNGAYETFRSVSILRQGIHGEEVPR